MTRQSMLLFAPLVFGIYLPMCPAPELRPTMPADQVDISELWVRPVDIGRQDLFYGPWGREHAPDPGGTYRFVRPKTQWGESRYDGDRCARTQVERQAGASRLRACAGGADRGGGVADSVGGRLPPAAGLLPARLHAARHVWRTHRAGWSVPPRSREPEGSRLVVVAAESIRRHPAL